MRGDPAAEHRQAAQGRSLAELAVDIRLEHGQLARRSASCASAHRASRSVQAPAQPEASVSPAPRSGPPAGGARSKSNSPRSEVGKVGDPAASASSRIRCAFIMPTRAARRRPPCTGCARLQVEPLLLERRRRFSSCNGPDDVTADARVRPRTRSERRHRDERRRDRNFRLRKVDRSDPVGPFGNER